MAYCEPTTCHAIISQLHRRSRNRTADQQFRNFYCATHRHWQDTDPGSLTWPAQKFQNCKLLASAAVVHSLLKLKSVLLSPTSCLISQHNIKIVYLSQIFADNTSNNILNKQSFLWNNITRNWCCFWPTMQECNLLFTHLRSFDTVQILNKNLYFKSLPRQVHHFMLTVLLKYILFCRCHRGNWNHKNAVQPLLVIVSRRSHNRQKDKDLSVLAVGRISSDRKDQHTPTPLQLSTDSPQYQVCCLP